MSLRNLVLSILLTICTLNSSGLTFAAERVADAGSHEAGLSMPVGEDAECGANLAECKFHCQGHCAQHFNVLPSDGAFLPALSPGRVSLVDLGARTPVGMVSSLFRPPRTASL